MTYADSIVKLIAQQSAELQRILSTIDDAATGLPSAREWSANEIMLHLIGATRDTAAGLRRALTETIPVLTGEQPGGEYLEVPGAGSMDDLLRLLLNSLDEISDSVSGLDDDTLRRPLTIVAEEAEPMTNVPTGIWLRYAFGDHFDTHLDQLRATASAAGRSVNAPAPESA